MAKFIEAQQFKGAWPDPQQAAFAQSQLAIKPRELRSPPWNTLEGEDMLHKMMQPPPFDGKVSMYFQTGKSFDIQTDHEGQGRQYLVMDPDPGRSRQRAYVGDWVCLLPSGKYIVLSDEDYRAFTE